KHKKSVNCMRELEMENPSFGVVATWNKDYRLRHLVTGSYHSTNQLINQSANQTKSLLGQYLCVKRAVDMNASSNDLLSTSSGTPTSVLSPQGLRDTVFPGNDNNTESANSPSLARMASFTSIGRASIRSKRTLKANALRKYISGSNQSRTLSLSQ